MAWRDRLSKLVQVAPSLESPDERFRVRPPSGVGWPVGVPGGGTLPDFYARCDGGTFPAAAGVVEIFPLDQLAARSHDLEERLRTALEAEDRVSSFVRGRHVFFGWDTVGDLYHIWDAERDELIGYMPHDDHDWIDHESARPMPMNEYFEEIFSREAGRVGSALSQWWVGVLAGLDS